MLNLALVSSDHDGDELELYSAGQMSVAVRPTKEIQFPQAHAEEGLRVQSRLTGSPLTVVKVPAVTLDEALVRAKAPREIDFFSLDVEGFEEEVLKGLNFEKWAFRWVLVETRNLAELQVFMQDRGYSFHSQLGDLDALFVNQDLMR